MEGSGRKEARWDSGRGSGFVLLRGKIRGNRLLQGVGGEGKRFIFLLAGHGAEGGGRRFVLEGRLRVRLWEGKSVGKQGVWGGGGVKGKH